MDDKREKSSLLFFNEAIEYFDKFADRDSFIDDPVRESRFNTNFLRNSMLNELNNLKDIIEHNPDSKIKALSQEGKAQFHKFISFYKKCPICGNHNHYFNLKRLFFDESKKNLIRELIRLMNLKYKQFRRYNLNLGVPCCDCFKRMTVEK